jgi:hypothetical protein
MIRDAIGFAVFAASFYAAFYAAPALATWVAP